ncbi:hypothetical protein CTM88_20735 [Photobacterium aquimaris]|uniref:Uncharacterized protein n=1 Tax=Photobacterium aquimaris TaxID=512643 RepID=A0A2T3IED1_9GAMM|nr:hypothetical protein [Photobacterium aquimaris]PSU21551.1 hypothetical protein CTM88_20735 [Photobacterium aquimaris]
MKEILNSVKENTAARLNNHIIGAYIFSWILCHLKIFLIFIISSSEEQLDLISNATFEPYRDAIFPLIIMVLYLFVLPFFNVQYERFFYFYQKRRNKIKNIYMVDFYNEVTESNRAKVKSDEAYLKDIVNKQLEGWASQSRHIIDFKLDYSRRIINWEAQIKKDKDAIKILDERLEGFDIVYSKTKENRASDTAFLEAKLNDIERLLNDDNVVEAAALLEQIRFRFDIGEDIPF